MRLNRWHNELTWAAVFLRFVHDWVVPPWRSEPMIRTTAIAWAAAASALALGECLLPAKGLTEPVEAYCTLDWHNECNMSIEGMCLASERDGHFYVDSFLYLDFTFLRHEEGVTFERHDKDGGDTFVRDGHYTLKVFREDTDNAITSGTKP